MNPQSYPGTSPDLTDGGSGAIAASQHRSGVASPLSRFASSPFGRSSHIAGTRLEILCILACLAIWGGTFHAMGVI